MTQPFTLALRGATFHLPNGEPLFRDLDERFDGVHTALVGRNGVGKSQLARMLAGELHPSSGHCLRQGRIHYLPQRLEPQRYPSVAALAGVQAELDALARIERGDVRADDLDRLDGRWDIRQRLEAALAAAGLEHLAVDTPCVRLSGGECTRVALLGAWLSDADCLILDEPSNHLDRPAREDLREHLQRWPGGLLLISHDRLLLEDMPRFVELSPHGLRAYSGGYARYREAREQEQGAAERELQRRKLERQREVRDLRQQAERQAQRQAQGRRQAQEANQAKILLGRQKARSDNSSGRLAERHAARRGQLDAAVQQAFAQLPESHEVYLQVPASELPEGRQVLLFDDLRVPGGTCEVPLRLTLAGPQRVALIGPNGCGKSRLLKVLAGELAPLSGSCRVNVPFAYLDQHLAHLDGERSVIELLGERAPATGEAQLRTRLAQLGLPAGRIDLPLALLSGGERVRAALACALYREQPAQLLLLDEPDNHLDLTAQAALEQLLQQYRGALLVASHDEAFLAALGLDGRLCKHATGWQWQPVHR
ncbi:MAG: putative ABC transporter ATP-binding protein YheS [Pseudomonas citronellolis]|nr:MAG: putative ABC transporter ATP-binding protein YheS [Pseudomonas citronellolis]